MLTVRSAAEWLGAELLKDSYGLACVTDNN